MRHGWGPQWVELAGNWGDAFVYQILVVARLLFASLVQGLPHLLLILQDGVLGEEWPAAAFGLFGECSGALSRTDVVRS